MLDKLMDYENKISLVLFNLGYLPGGNKNITTNWNTTRKAIEDAFKLLNNKGMILIVVYPGHDEGKIESDNLKNYLKKFKVTYYYNDSKDYSPYLIMIKK